MRITCLLLVVLRLNVSRQATFRSAVLHRGLIPRPSWPSGGLRACQPFVGRGTRAESIVQSDISPVSL